MIDISNIKLHPRLTVITGSNNSGKSLTLRAISHTYQPVGYIEPTDTLDMSIGSRDISSEEWGQYNEVVWTDDLVSSLHEVSNSGRRLLNIIISVMRGNGGIVLIDSADTLLDGYTAMSLSRWLSSQNYSQVVCTAMSSDFLTDLLLSAPEDYEELPTFNTDLISQVYRCVRDDDTSEVTVASLFDERTLTLAELECYSPLAKITYEGYRGPEKDCFIHDTQYELRSDAVIWDLDGTLVESKWRAKFLEEVPKNREAFHAKAEFSPKICHNVHILRALNAYGTMIVLVTGRPDTYKKSTERWLYKYGITYNRLIMRKEGDHRPDHRFKKEVLEELREKYNIICAFEDRTSVVNMWRDNGVPCLQVDEGDF